HAWRSGVLAAMLMLASAAARADDPAGVWLTKDGESHVRIERCGDAWCGRIIWLKDPNDPDTGRPWTDKANDDPAKRNRPIIGLQTVLDMRPARRPNHWDGKVYDPRRGSFYQGSLALEAPGRLRVEGCLLLLCEDEVWTRVTEPVPPPPRR